MAYAWVALGRAVLTPEQGGWITVILVAGSPVFLTALLLPAFVVARRERTGREPFSRQEAIAQTAVWIGLVLLGFTLVDFGDSPSSQVSVIGSLLGLPPDHRVLTGGFRAARYAVQVGWGTQMTFVLLHLISPMMQTRRNG